ncbi:MAG: hypothetical protein P1S60_09665 [Anaerolineae bacterium]|nr:hypothetical protein [Anaerolineae bacterium]
MEKDPKVEMLGESQNYAIWCSFEKDETEAPVTIYHIEFGNITLHLFEEEWAEFTEVMMSAIR